MVTLTMIEAELDVELDTRYKLVQRRDCSERVNLALPTSEDALIAMEKPRQPRLKAGSRVGIQALQR